MSELLEEITDAVQRSAIVDHSPQLPVALRIERERLIDEIETMFDKVI